MAGYSDEWNEMRPPAREIRAGLIARFEEDGYGIAWKPGSDQWASDHIAHLECLWCGVLVWNHRLHRHFCTGQVVDLDVEPPPPPLT